MEYKKSGWLLTVFALSALFISGCATMAEEGPVAQPSQLEQQVRDKDARISSLQEIIDDQQRQLRQLSDQLNTCESSCKANQGKAASAP